MNARSWWVVSLQHEAMREPDWRRAHDVRRAHEEHDEHVRRHRGAAAGSGPSLRTATRRLALAGRAPVLRALALARR